jgi:branched-chain amino acid transport system ATP-binding protein/branched-chain amino acid transport system permease protein
MNVASALRSGRVLPQGRVLRRVPVWVAALVGALMLPYGLGSYWIHVADVALVYGVVALGLCLTFGIAGQINLAQVTLFGVGAYTSAILTTHGWGFWPSALAAFLAASASGLVVGLPALRVQSHYLGIVTLGLALAFTNLVTNTALTGAADGLNGLPSVSFAGADLGDEYLFYYLALASLLVVLGWAALVVHTRLGRRLRAMRDDHLAAASVGAEIPLLRMLAFALGGLFGGVAGALYAGLIRFVSPESFSLTTMFFVLAAVIIGGRGSLFGSLLGAVLLVVLREQLSDYASYAQLVYGSLIVVMVVFAPTGLADVPARVRTALAARRPGDRATGGATPYRIRRTEETGVRPAGVDGAGVRAAEDAVAVDGLTMRFRGLVALDGVTLRVPAGQIRGIVGPNGSGKTTLFNVLSGIYVPSAGRVRVLGGDTTGFRPYRLAQAGLARTFQNLRLFRRITVRDNVLVALDRSRTSWAWRYLLWPAQVLTTERALRRRADEILAAYGLSEVAGALPTSLSYGTQRRVEIARAMAGGPRLLLLDEPAAGLNGDEVRQLGEMVRDLRAEGVTVVLIEHNMGLVMSLCEQVTVLANGRVIADGSPDQVSRDRQVIEAYLGDPGEVVR